MDADNELQSASKEPPIGLMPHYVWKAKMRTARIHALAEAMFRYADARKQADMPLEWFVELSALCREEEAEARGA